MVGDYIGTTYLWPGVGYVRTIGSPRVFGWKWIEGGIHGSVMLSEQWMTGRNHYTWDTHIIGLRLKCEWEGDVLVMNPPCQAVAKHCLRTLIRVRTCPKGESGKCPHTPPSSGNNRDGGWRINVTFRRIVTHLKGCPIAPICYTCSQK